MQQVENYINLLNQDKQQVASQFNATSEYNVLFVNPQICGSDFYKLILPGLMLRETKQIATAFTNISWFNPSKQFKNIDDIFMASPEILWAHVIVFPFLNQPLHELFQQIRLINNRIKIIYHVDFNFFTLPETHPYKSLFTEAVNKQIFKNIAAADRTVVANKKLAAAMLTRQQQDGSFADPAKFAAMVLCTDEKTMLPGIPSIPPNPSTELHLCILCNGLQLHDLKAAMSDLKDIKAKHGDMLKITVFGLNPKNNSSGADMAKTYAEITEGIPHETIPPVSVTRYLLKLANINPDLFLIPSDKSDYSQTSNCYKRFLDCALISKPVITPKCFPMDGVIEHGETGLLYSSKEELEKMLETAIADKKTLLTFGAHANSMVRQEFVYTPANMQMIINTLG